MSGIIVGGVVGGGGIGKEKGRGIDVVVITSGEVGVGIETILTPSWEDNIIMFEPLPLIRCSDIAATDTDMDCGWGLWFGGAEGEFTILDTIEINNTAIIITRNNPDAWSDMVK